MTNPFRSAVLAALAALLLSATAIARPSEGKRPDRPPCGGPPREAVEACDGRKADDACSFETPRGDDIEGTCKIVGEEQVLACVPADGPPPRPPKE
jgi:hypothetical protein